MATDDGQEAAGSGGEGDTARAGDLALYGLLVESVRDYGIFAMDAGGHILTWNAGAQRFEGYSRAEIVGRHFVASIRRKTYRRASRRGLRQGNARPHRAAAHRRPAP